VHFLAALVFRAGARLIHCGGLSVAVVMREAPVRATELQTGAGKAAGAPTKPGQLVGCISCGIRSDSSTQLVYIGSLSTPHLVLTPCWGSISLADRHHFAVKPLEDDRIAWSAHTNVTWTYSELFRHPSHTPRLHTRPQQATKAISRRRTTYLIIYCAKQATSKMPWHIFGLSHDANR
jgi:hypothetical protein